MNDYKNRILPVVGKELSDKTILFSGSSSLTHVFRLFSRSLVFNYLIDSDSGQGRFDSILDLGKCYAEKPLSDAMREYVENQNHWEKNWKITQWNRITLPHLFIIANDPLKGIQNVNFCKQNKIPLVGFFILKNRPFKTMAVVCHPQIIDSYDMFRETMAFLQGKITEITLENRLEYLDISTIVSQIGRELLFSEEYSTRDELKKQIIENKKTVLFRGTEHWPWAIGFTDNLQKISEILSTTERHPVIPSEYFQKKKIFILGCGTGSLFVREGFHHFGKLFLADGKPFSIYNPIRQEIYSTDVNSKLKPYVLAERILAENKVDYQKNDNRDYSVYSTRENEILFASRILATEQKQRCSLGKLKKMLNFFQPDLVIVSTGRTLDDNFSICKILREKQIPHLVPSAYFGALQYKVISCSPEFPFCYDCFSGRIAEEFSYQPEISGEARDLFYGENTQPATMMETYGSTLMLLTLARQMLLKPMLRNKWFQEGKNNGEQAYIGSNKILPVKNGYAFGLKIPFSAIRVHPRNFDQWNQKCPVCGSVF